MKKLLFLFNISLLVLTFSLVSCGKRCIDPAANNSTEKGDCVYPADEFAGTYSMTCNCSPTSGGGASINKTFDLQMVKIDNDEVALKNLQDCGSSINIQLIQKSYNANIVGLNSTCGSDNYMMSGTINLVPNTGDLTVSYNMSSSTSGVTWYNCTATGKRK